MSFKIDLDRGVMAMRQPLTKGGVYVYMYLDEPGTYLNEHGHKVSEAFAADVGFNTAHWRKELTKRERLAEAKAKIEAELDMISEEIENTLKEVGGFRIIALANDMAQVKDPDGTVVNHMPIPVADAEVLLAALTGDEPQSTPAKKGK
jgi:hypothetical protein